MKKYFIPICLLVMVVFSFAGSERSKETIQNTSKTLIITNTTTHAYSGYLESIYIDIPSAATCTVTVATGDETLLTATAISTDTMYRPRYLAHSSVGGILAIATNDAVMKCLGMEKLTITVESNAAATNNAYVYITTKE